MFSAELTALNSPGGCRFPTSRLIAPTAPGNHKSSDGTSTGSEEEKWAADEDAGPDAGWLLEESIDPLPEATVATLFELSEGKALFKLLISQEDGPNLSPVPADEGEGLVPLVVPEVTLVGPLALMGTELKKHVQLYVV